MALPHGSHVVLLPRFGPEATLGAIETHHADVVYLVPTMMKRIWQLPVEVRLRHDLSSLQTVWHLAEPCPPWLTDAWIERLGPERIWELCRGTEGAGRSSWRNLGASLTSMSPFVGTAADHCR